MKDDDSAAAAAPAAAAASAAPSSPARLKSSYELAAEIEKQAADMAALEDEADRIALKQSMAETLQDLDEFSERDADGKATPANASVTPAPSTGAGKRVAQAATAAVAALTQSATVIYQESR